MTDGESGDDKLKEIRQPGFEMRDLPVLDHCFIKKPVREMDYFGQKWVLSHSLLCPRHIPQAKASRDKHGGPLK